MFVIAYYHTMDQASVWLDHYYESPLKASVLEEAIVEAKEKWLKMLREFGTYRAGNRWLPCIKRPHLRRVEDFKDVKIA